ncbi:MAG: hypothetical protein ACXV8G_00075 [Acidimicrobiales bacterium]
MREKRRKQKPEPTPDPDAERAAAESPTIVRRKVSRGVGAEPEEATGPAEAESATGAPTPAAPSSDAADQFDALGTEIAAVLRQAQETSEKVRTEAAEHALAAVTQAEANARRIVEQAVAEARDKLAQAEAQIEQQWTAAAQQLEEATQALEVARQQDRALRQDAADHLANALAARDAGAEILEGATRQLERAEAAARDLEAHAEAARQEAAQIAADLHALAEHFGEGSGVIDLRADAVAPAGADEASAEPGDDVPSAPAESTEST